MHIKEVRLKIWVEFVPYIIRILQWKRYASFHIKF